MGLTVQREDDMGKLINADEDIGMNNSKFEYAGQIVEGRISTIGKNMFGALQKVIRW